MSTNSKMALASILAMTGATLDDFIPKPNGEPAGDCECGGKYYMTPASGKPRCNACKKLKPKNLTKEGEPQGEPTKNSDVGG